MKTDIAVFKCEACGTFNEIKPSEKSILKHKLPDGLENFLVNFTVELLKQQPSDLDKMNEFGYNYFSKKIINKTNETQSSKLSFKNNNNVICFFFFSIVLS